MAHHKAHRLIPLSNHWSDRLWRPNVTRPARDRGGNVAVETALCVPFVLLFLFCAIDIWQHLTVKYRVEAAAVSLAEVLVNEPAKGGEAPWDAISSVRRGFWTI